MSECFVAPEIDLLSYTSKEGIKNFKGFSSSIISEKGLFFSLNLAKVMWGLNKRKSIPNPIFATISLTFT